MDEVVKHVWASVVAVVGWVLLILGACVNWDAFLERRVPAKWQRHPSFSWILFCCFGMAVSLNYIWSQPAAPQVAKAEPIKPNEEKDREPVVNQQAKKMARQFESMLEKVTGKRLFEDGEEKWFEDYLSATMPAKIEAICGTKERRQYEKLLRDLKAGSSDVQHHFHGLEPFVTRERYIDHQTPLAGPEIELNEIEPEVPVKPKDIIASKPPLDVLPPFDDGIPGDAPIKQPTPKVRPTPEPEPEPESAEPERRPPPTPKQVDPVEAFLERAAWLQCHGCGQRYDVTNRFFAHFDSKTCDRCGNRMQFGDYRQKIVDEAWRIRGGMEFDPRRVVR
jgi:hypothetical protein